MADHDCDRFARQMWLYLSDELSEVERKQWDAHLASCGRCRQNLRDVRDTLDAYDQAPKPTPSGQVVLRVLDQCWARPVRSRLLRRSLAPLLALAALLFIALGRPQLLPVGKPGGITERVVPPGPDTGGLIDRIFSIRLAISNPALYLQQKQALNAALQSLSRRLDSYWISEVTHRAHGHPTQ